MIPQPGGGSTPGTLPGPGGPVQVEPAKPGTTPGAVTGPDNQIHKLILPQPTPGPLSGPQGPGQPLGPGMLPRNPSHCQANYTNDSTPGVTGQTTNTKLLFNPPRSYGPQGQGTTPGYLFPQKPGQPLSPGQTTQMIPNLSQPIQVKPAPPGTTGIAWTRSQNHLKYFFHRWRIDTRYPLSEEAFSLAGTEPQQAIAQQKGRFHSN
ncbi:hypothetical protein AVEN_40617-1 [Araneus ventricosus]|uniref:Uncharacterized protein n=1 Tax=Araneus ventricosus TaxID=182803 RepID=A0A4Y2J9S3_ARAVE|nr:hypothetical protein AVEN_40617-1 [Araneus ventricosus]